MLKKLPSIMGREKFAKVAKNDSESLTSQRKLDDVKRHRMNETNTAVRYSAVRIESKNELSHESLMRPGFTPSTPA
jgi:uncharacterized membrane protein YgaE (UPF0421/DUF939 family)